MSDGIVWINGKLARGSNDSKISVFDRGLLYGDGLFETIRSYDGKLFKPSEHLSRLFKSSGIIEMKIPYPASVLEGAALAVLKASNLKNAYLRITVTRGEGGFTLMRAGRSRPNVIVTAKKFTGYPTALYSRGVSAKVSEIRQDEHSPLSEIKSLNFLNHILARMRAQAGGFDEAILLNTKGNVAEAATSNVFLVKAGKVVTPSLNSGILPGVTRSVIIEIAGKLGIKAAERAVSPEKLLNADEVFLTNSLAEVLPVTKIDSKRIGDGSPGKLTKLFHLSYKKEVAA